MSNNPTAKQRRKWQRVAEIGCIACLIDGVHSPCSIHHGKDNGGYRNHDYVFGLCPPHHQPQFAVDGVPNRHGNRREFEERYGTDRELWRRCEEMLGNK